MKGSVRFYLFSIMGFQGGQNHTFAPPARSQGGQLAPLPPGGAAPDTRHLHVNSLTSRRLPPSACARAHCVPDDHEHVHAPDRAQSLRAREQT